MPRHVTFVLFDGFAATDAVGPADVFAAANAAAGDGRYRLRYAAVAAEVQASNHMTFRCETLDVLAGHAPHTLLVPGADEAPLTAALADPALMNWIATTARRARRVCSVCSGAFVLAELGLLEGRRATTHWRGLEELKRRSGGLRVEASALYVEDDGVWTSAGVTAGIDMALAIVERDLGRSVAMAVARELVLFLVRPGGQPQFSAPLDLQEKAASTDLRALPPWLEERLAERVSVAAMAEAMNMSERSFHRRCTAVFGMTPLSLLQRLRLERARALLEDAAVPLKAVASQAGLGDVAGLGKAVRAHLGVTPGEYRQRFGALPRQT